MIYLVGQIVLCLLFTFVIGITVGWLVRGLGASRHTDTVEARWRARLAELQRKTGARDEEPGPAAAAAAAEIQTLKDQVRQRDEALAALQTAGAAPKTDNKSLARQIREANELCNRLQGHLAEQRASASQLNAQLERAGREKEMLVQRLRDRESEIGRMSQERQHAINTIASLQKEMRVSRGTQLRQAEAKTARRPVAGLHPDDAPETATPAATTTPAALPRQTGTQSARPPGVTPEPAETAQRPLPIATPSPKTVAAYEPDWRLTAPRGRKDNLQAIYGIGPKLEMQLNALGIFHFEQIARFSKDDILWVARHLKSFPGRIVRDRWLQQAQTLLQQKRQ